MEWMRLDHTSIFDLAILILSVSSVGFLIGTKKKSINTRFLTWTFIGFAMFTFSNFIPKFNPWWLQGLWTDILSSVLLRIGISIALIYILKFAYNFPTFINKFQREYRIILMILKIVYISIFVLWSIDIFTYVTLYAQGKEIPFYKIYSILFSVIPYTIFEASVPILFFWTIIVFFRKVVMFSSQTTKNFFHIILKPQGRSARTARLFGMVMVLLALCGLSGLITPPYTPLIIYISYIYLRHMIMLISIMIFIVLFINHSPDFSTFRIKIIGFTLVIMLSVLSILSFYIGLSNNKSYTNKTLISEKKTISYTPLKDGSYFVDNIPYQFDDFLGDKVQYNNEETRKKTNLNFEFHFYDKSYSTIQFWPTGTVLLGDPENGYFGGHFPKPAIVLLDIGLDTNVVKGGVYIKHEKDKLTITWNKLPEIGYSDLNTFQLVLRENGTIEMNYQQLNPGGKYSIWNTTSSFIGILPGGRDMPKEAIRYNSDLPYKSKPGSGVYEDYLTDFFDYCHRGIMPFALAMILSSLFIILVFPLMLKTSLIKPLYAIKDGIKKVNDGDLNITVEPLYNDEIGYLTESFNKMVLSMKKANKLKDDFLANTSHELRTPLNGIIGIAESLIDGALGPLPDSALINLSMIVSSGKRLSSLINDILDFSKLKQGVIIIQKRPVNIKRHIEVVCLLSKPLLAGKELKIVSFVPNDISNVLADQNRLQQILFNLVGNAIKFTAAGEICISAEAVGEFVKISVKDTGIGIPDEHLNDVFKSFEQIDASISREYGGTGLGLSITKNLVELHGGTINVESKLGEGSIFTFTLPLSSEKANENETDRMISHIDLHTITDEDIVDTSLTSSNDITILVVDDEPINLQVLVNHLSLSNYQILQARSGEEALKFCRGENPPDLILLDIMMPKMDGYEVCQKLRENIPANELPVILLTAKNQVSDLVDGFDSGANDYITKPFSKSELLARIKIHLELSKINIAYSHFVPHEFLQILHKASIIDLRLGDQIQKEMTIMFSDIRDFTTLSEGLTPKETFDFLNSYLERIVPIIRNHGGFIDKYIGDAIMALFPGNIEEVINTSIEMQKEIDSFNEERSKAKLKQISAGIGLHTGNLILGTIGEKSRMEATVISDAVNLASRVEGLTKLYAAPVIISDSSYNSIKDKASYSFRFIGKIQVKGKTQATEVYEVLNGYQEDQKQLKIKTRESFKKGLELYYSRDFAEAAVYFNNVLKENSQDKAAQIYRERSASFLVNPPPLQWKGIESLDVK